MTYEQAIEYIHSTCWKGSRPGLERITRLLDMLDHPEKSFYAIHVAGTNGKGSFCAMLESILRNSGYKTGLFTSPYVEFFEERMCANGEMIPKNTLAEITAYVKSFADSMEDTPTEFELITAIGFEYFKRAGIKFAVVECGMGGRLDSTNVFEKPLLSVITGVSLDHTEYLGDTIKKIAKEKAGIIKPGCPILFGGEDPEAERVIKNAAKRLGARYLHTDRTKLKLISAGREGSIFDYKRYERVKLSLLGVYQPYNAANVLEAVELLRGYGIAIPDESLRKSIFETKWKARFEKLSDDPEIYFDGGHNIEGVAAACETVKKYFPGEKINIISGVMADKKYEDMVALIQPVADHVFTVTPDNARSLPADEYAKVFREHSVPSEGYDSYEEALEAAIARSRKSKKPILAVGSLYSYAQFVGALRKLSKD